MTHTSTTPVHERVVLQGLACHELSLPGGNRVLVAEHGGQVLSWVAEGRERLYLSPAAVLDGRAAIRGGIPVCWPQFSNRGPLPRHGWVRQSAWRFLGADLDPVQPRLTLGIDPAVALPSTLGPWAHVCRLELSVVLAPGCLQVSLSVFNEGPSLLPFTGALHTYLALDSADTATVSGWTGGRGWDSVRGEPCEAVPRLGLSGEIDRILPAPVGGLSLHDGAHRLLIEQAGWTDTVVWNPGAEKCAALSDMAPGDEQRMACIEAAQALSAAHVEPGGVWVGHQRLTLATGA